MNDDLQQALAEMVSKINSGADAVAQFGAEQMPVVLQQLLLWHGVTSAFWCAFWLVLAAICARTAAGYQSRRAAARAAYDRGEEWTRFGVGSQVTSVEYDIAAGRIGFMAPAFAAFACLLLACANSAWLKILLAPELYLLEYAAQIVR